MNVLVFDIKGRFAHFRKFYTNSSSLSYLLPPRTTLMGIVAAILGLERDSYYEVLSSENLDITARIMFKPRKVMQTLNYMKIESPKDTFKARNHTQVPFEIIASQENNVIYRVYLSHKDKEMYEKIKNNLIHGKCEYPPYFGAAPFSAKIEFVGEYRGDSSEGEAMIVTPVNKEYIEKINFGGNNLVLARERMPRDFDRDRMISGAGTYIFDEEGSPILVKLNCNSVKLETGENIIFM